MATPVEFEVKVKGGRRAATEMDRFGRSIRDTEKAATSASTAMNRSATATRGLSDAARQSGREMGLQVNLISELALGFGALDPKLRNVALGFASAGNNAVTMGASMGPLGVAIAVMAGALPGLISLLSDTGNEMREAGNKAQEAAEHFRTLASAIREARGAERDLTRIARGLGTVDEQRAALGQISGQAQGAERTLSEAVRGAARGRGSAAVIESELAAATSPGDMRRRLQQLEARGLIDLGSAQSLMAPGLEAQRLGRLRSQAAENLGRARARRGQGGIVSQSTTQEEQEAIEEALAAKQRGGGRGRGGRGRGGASQDPFDRRSPLQRQDVEGGQGGLFLSRRDISEQLRDQRASLAEKEREERKKALELERQMRTEAERANDAWDYRLAREREINEARREAIRDASDIADGALELFNATEGQMELARGFSQVAQAVGSYPDVVGIAKHGISAALHFKNAATLGVGGGGGAADTGGGTNVRPIAPQGGGGGGGGPAAVTVNFNAPTDEAQLGRLLDRSSRAARRRFG